MISMGSSMSGWGSSGGVPSHIRKSPSTLKSSPWQLIRRLSVIILEFKRDLIVSFVCVLGAAGLQITMPWASSPSRSPSCRPSAGCSTTASATTWP